MKNKNRFNSYAEALKRLELLKGQESLNEATKYVLKKKNEDTPPAEAAPALDVPPAPEAPPTGGEQGSDLPPAPGGEPSADAGGMDLPPSSPEDTSTPEEVPSSDASTEGGDSKRSDYMAEVQKYAGKLGQELRDQGERLESDDIKYVLNMTDLFKISYVCNF